MQVHLHLFAIIERKQLLIKYSMSRHFIPITDFFIVRISHIWSLFACTFFIVRIGPIQFNFAFNVLITSSCMTLPFFIYFKLD